VFPGLDQYSPSQRPSGGTLIISPGWPWYSSCQGQLVFRSCDRLETRCTHSRIVRQEIENHGKWGFGPRRERIALPPRFRAADGGPMPKGLGPTTEDAPGRRGT
jgi:hypothetical protein